MKISTFQARDMREVLKEVKAKLGADAVILSTRSIRSPGSGLGLGRTLIEVTACPGPNSRGGVADTGERKPTPPPVAPAAERPAPPPKPTSFSRVVDDEISYPVATTPPQKREREQKQEQERDQGRVERKDTAAEAASPSEATPPREVATARVSLEAEPVPAADAELDRDPLPEPPLSARASFDSSGELTALDAESKRNYSWLLMHGVEEPIARRIVLMDRSGKERGLAVAFQRALKFRDPLAGPARVIALVGPTGVGKTTTLAKVAADLILNRQRSVGMITLDTFRVGAVAQLETYAKLLQVRLVVARAPSEVKAGLHSLNRCDYVLVDTVGSSPYNRRQVNSTATLLPDIGDDREVILCMAANVRETEQQAIYRRFSILKPTGLIFTKLDETVTYGGILNVCIKADLPLTMYTDGQRVPENLGWMSAKTLSKWFARDTQADL
ncbi:MAG: flagellar biosynthesis protein FlhF [Magnetococcales bacterium]|nr:flagellar biosynthesis protein FlhF [Magnetococcales bacterium]